MHSQDITTISTQPQAYGSSPPRPTTSRRSTRTPPQVKQKQMRPLVIYRSISTGSIISSDEPLEYGDILVTPTFRSTYRESDYVWSDDVVITVKWGKDHRPDIGEIELPRGYYSMAASVTSSGNCNVQVLCYQTTTPPLNDTVASFPHATVSSSSTRFTVSQPKGILRFDIAAAGKIKDLTGALTLTIRTRGAESAHAAKVDRITSVGRIDEVALLSKITRKDLGDAHPLWVSEIPQVNRAWIRDLSREGVEPNPGPVPMLSFMADRSLATKDYSYLESMLALIGPRLNSNPFALLSLFEAPDYAQTADIELELDLGEDRPTTKPTGKGAQRDQPTDKRRTDQDTPASGRAGRPKVVVDSAKQFDSVTTRIACRLSNLASPMRGLIYWLNRRPSRKLFLSVLGKMNIRTDTDTLDPCKFAIYAYVNNLNDQDIFDAYCDAFDPTMTFSLLDRQDGFKELISSTSPYIPGAVRAHNKRMHSLNGNIFVKGFEGVRESPNWKSVVRTPQGTSATNRHISDYETYFSSYAKVSGPNVTDLRDMDGVVSDYVSTDNTVIGGKRVRFPCSPLHPMSFYSSSDATSIMRPNLGLPYASAGLVEYRTNLLTDTAKCTELKQSIQNAASTRFRATDIDAAGFMSLDVANIARESIAKGFSMEAPTMKWLLLADILSLQKNKDVPRSIYMNVDGYVPHDPATVKQTYGSGIRAITEIVNTSFPFVGEEGTIRFHLSLETVEANRRSNAVFIPPMIYQNAQNPQINMFLFVVGLVEWPFNIYSFDSTVSSPSNVDSTFDFIHRACLTRIPGPIHIDIIIPRRTSEVKPRTNVEAARLVQMCPVTTVAGVATVVDFTTEISSQKDNSLSKYLDTYGPSVTLSDVYNFLSAINLKHNISKTIDVCHDLLAASVYTFPQLVDDTSSVHYPGGVAWDAETSAIGLRKLTDTATIWGGILPRTSTRKAPWSTARKPTFQLMDFSYQAWNKITLGLAKSEDTAPSTDCSLNPTIGVSKQIYWTVLKSITLAITTQVTMAAIGFTSDCWDAALNNLNSRAVQDVAKAIFCEELSPGQLRPAPLSSVFSAIHSHLFSVGLASVTYTSGITPIRITCYSRPVMPASFIKVLAGPVEPRDIQCSGLYTPTFLADVFVNVMTEKNLKFICNMLPAYAVSGTMGFSSGLLPKNMPRSGEMGPYVDADVQDGVAPINKTFALSDEHMWNNRIFMTSGVLKVVDHTTMPVEESHGNLNPRQRKTCGTWGVDISPDATSRTHTAGSCTMTFPSMTKHALLPIPVVGSDRRMALSLAQQGCSPLPRESWRIDGCALVTNSETNASGGSFWGDLMNSDFGQPASNAEQVEVDQRIQAQVIRAPEAELAPAEAVVADLVQPAA